MQGEESEKVGRNHGFRCAAACESGRSRHNGRMKRTRALTISLWGVALILVGVLIGVVVTAIGPVNALDRGWLALMVEARVDPMVAVGRFFDWLGGGWRATLLVPGIVVVALALLRRPWGIAFFASSALLSVILVQLLKSIFARARPEDMLVVSDFGSFPSGHAANAATVMVVLIVLLRNPVMTIIGVVWIIAMAWSRTYLGAHWLTDTIAGIAIGTGAALVMLGVFSAQLEKENDARHPATV